MSATAALRRFSALLFAASVAASPSFVAHSQGQNFLADSSVPAQPTTFVATPEFVPTPEQVGDALMIHQRYQAAIEAFKKEPKKSADLWNKTGIAYQLMYSAEEATRCYRSALQIDPKNAQALNNLGTVSDSYKLYRDGERFYRKALRIEPNSALILKNLGTNLLSQHKFDKGWEAYQAALAIDPLVFEASGAPRIDNPASVESRGAMNYYMAKGCLRAGNVDRAIQYLRNALNEGFTNPKKIASDNEFASLHGMPAFEQLLTSQGTR
jgi:tetratricopeptide (TPR) repeat protein